MRRHYDLLALPEVVRARASFDPVETPGVRGRWVRPRPQYGPLAGGLLYLHGGAYVLGSARSHRAILSGLAVEAELEVLGLDYRLAPEHPFPAGRDDALAAYRLMLERWPAERLAIAGDSAGGGLTLSTLVAIRDAGLPLPAGAILISPWTDLEATYPRNEADYIVAEQVSAWATWYAGDRPLSDPGVSPIHADLRGLCPLLVLAGGAEVLLPDAEAVVARARALGVHAELLLEPGEVHVYPQFYTPRAKRAYREMRRFLQRRFRTESRAAFERELARAGERQDPESA